MWISCGEKRIALDRDSWHDHSMQMFDENIQSLDHQSERQIVDEIKSLKEQVTLTVIAHRLTSFKILTGATNLYIVQFWV